jgi:DNA helicase-2/ATP-dependent DNA helicase PcrA
MIDGWKNRGQGPADRSPRAKPRLRNGKGRELYKAYQERLKTLNACDFGDLLLPPDPHLPRQSGRAEGIPQALQIHPRRRIPGHQRRAVSCGCGCWRRRRGSVAAAEGGRAIGRRAKPPQGGRTAQVNICCVGDDDQSIYGWRGAEVDNILRFDKDFPGATIIRLERNYRSTAHILAAASHLIAHNEGRLRQDAVHRATSDGREGACHAAWDSEEEARADRRDHRDLAARGHNLNDMAILVRASFQMREFEDRFVTLGLNYRVIGGPRFYERMEIRDALAFFRVVDQGADDLAFERIVNVPKRGLGEATMQIHDTARRAAHPRCWRLPPARRKRRDEAEAARGSLREVMMPISSAGASTGNHAAHRTRRDRLDESGYTDMWKKDRSVEAPGRLENLKELIRSMEEFESLRSFLDTCRW